MGVPPDAPVAAALGVGGGGAMRVATPASAKHAEKAQASLNSCGSSARRVSSPAKDWTNFRPRSATCACSDAEHATTAESAVPMQSIFVYGVCICTPTARHCQAAVKVRLASLKKPRSR